MSSEKQTSKTGEKNGSSKDQVSESQTLTLLQGIKNGSINPKSLCPADRRLLVSFLIAEGQSNAEIALLLKTSDRTIERDRKAIRDENTITKDPELVKQMAGRLVTEADLCIQRIRKSARGKDTPASVKVDAEHRSFQIFEKTIERLKSLGFLPTATQRIEADLRHSAAFSLSLEEIQHEAGRLQGIKTSLPVKKVKKVKSRTVKGKGKNNE